MSEQAAVPGRHPDGIAGPVSTIRADGTQSSGRPMLDGPTSPPYDDADRVRSLRQRLTYDIPKRVLDVVLASTILVLAAPLLALAAVLVKATSAGPAIHRADRVGRYGVPFTMFKLRTMYVDSDHTEQQDFNRRELLGELEGVEVFTVQNDSRITRVGQVLRKLSIDELPQLWNVLRGEMSLVGPRPSVDWEVALFEPGLRRRELAVPGITGLWQVTGRRTIDMRGMLELDVQYVETRTLTGDIALLVRTIPAVITSTGAG